MLALAVIVAAVALGAPFGQAEASAVSYTGGLTVEVTVEVDGSHEAVLVRPFSSFEELAPTALRDRGGGVWGGFVILPSADDWSVVFDALDADGDGARSEPTTLTAMGVDPIVVSGPPASEVPRSGPDAGTIWLTAGIALALVALGLLAWWTFGDRNMTSGDDDGPSAGAEAAPGEGA